jgi:hypothetical protein
MQLAGAHNVHARGARALLPIALAVALVAPWTTVEAAAGGLGTPRPFRIDVASDRGSGRIDPGESCAEGGDGGYWHYDYETALPKGVVTGPQNPLNGSLRAHLDLHSERHVVRASPGELASEVPAAWLQGTDSALTFANQRGTVSMKLRSVADAAGASCTTAHTVGFDGTQATAAGLRWAITGATGSYRQAAGSGTADLAADVAPGADNPFALTMAGDIAVLQPNLKLEVVDTYWAFLGAHYLVRLVTVIYRVTNTGPGDAFGVKLTAASSPTVGMKLAGPLPSNTSTITSGPIPAYLADLPAGESDIVRLRWLLPMPAGNPPCGAVILGCEFDSKLTFDMPDALDVIEAPKSATVHAKAPNFPPPVVD